MEQAQSRSHLPAGATEHTFLVYDAESGEIVHGHTAVFFPGLSPDAGQLEREALKVAAQATERKASSLRALAVEHGELDVGAHYRVDTKSGRLERVTPKKSA
jgi:hypothetical protein